jgi:hypothetical protein
MVSSAPQGGNRPEIIEKYGGLLITSPAGYRRESTVPPYEQQRAEGGRNRR